MCEDPPPLRMSGAEPGLLQRLGLVALEQGAGVRAVQVDVLQVSLHARKPCVHLRLRSRHTTPPKELTCEPP